MGKEAEFDRLVDRYEKPIFNLIYRLIGDPDDAADLTQETFVAAYRSLDEFRGESTIYTWLYRIAVNKCKNRFKENDRRRAYEGSSLDVSEVFALGDQTTIQQLPDQVTPEAALEKKELRLRIEQAMSRLPPDYRIVAVLRDIQGLSYEQIAQATGLSIDVVRTRLARARGMLRRKLEPYLADYHG